MIGVSLHSADAIIIVFSVDEIESFEEARRLRDLVMSTKGPDSPIVIVGNKTDLDRKISKEETEAIVLFDWENGYVECSAKLNTNIQDIFKEVLNQSKTNISSISNGNHLSNGSSGSGSPLHMRRRQSLPHVPGYTRAKLQAEKSLPRQILKKNKEAKRKNACKVS
ncbi:GTP-binding protein Rheb homolog isoform X2 [Eurytemora carolleeae]|uniref:GTP-binding protein Rheb homolog isoform X2 n=1 Tax=Eurytemora carolleeae TaxID=1294199 RepID=UPI000C78C2FB|nr:GTP-binding protein Rheb homolog isoform X2 [Eurytemora carolleeae]|eukprot:XP_023322433.1 GTP-binding protein Rheb homolog isoform X2 [Eurytemora affinis]